MTLRWMPVLPLWAVAAIVVALLLLLVWGTAILARKRVPRRWLVLLGMLRFGIIAVFAACLLQPILTWSGSEKQGPPLLVMLDASQSMGVDGRLAETSRWLEESGLKKQLAARPNVHWFAFDEHARSIDPASAIEPAGTSTRYADSVGEAWDQWRQQSENESAAATVPGARVLLVSDGRDAASGDVSQLARQIGLAVDTLAPVAPPDAAAAPRLTIAQVQTPRRVQLGAEARLSVSLRQSGLSGQPLTLRVMDGDKPAGTKAFTFAANQSEATVSLPFRPEEAGLREFRLLIDGAPNDDGSATRQFSVQVAGGASEVLFLEDSWRWDFKFLRRVFEDDPGFTLTAFLSRGETSFVQLVEPDRSTQVTGIPQNRSELAGFDLMVLGNVDPRRWPRTLPAAIRAQVEEDGKSLIVIGGPGLRALLDTPDLAALLPVELSEESGNPVPGPVALRATADGLASPYFAAVGGVPADFWAELPPLDQVYPPLRKKPAATALLESADLANAYGKLIVMAEHPAGRGRVLYIGTDTLWKWRMFSQAAEDGPSHYQVFWQQALRALAPIRPGEGGVTFFVEPERSRVRPGETVTLRAEFSSTQSLAEGRVEAEVTLPDGKKIPLTFAADTTQPGRYSAPFAPTQPGQHRVAATGHSGDRTIADTTTAFDVETASAELADPAIDFAKLARIAEDTGGTVIDRADPNTWESLTAYEEIAVSREKTLDLWHGYSLLVLLSLLLGGDWLLRLLRGFA
jgi:hypothetical protein